MHVCMLMGCQIQSSSAGGNQVTIGDAGDGAETDDEGESDDDAAAGGVALQLTRPGRERVRGSEVGGKWVTQTFEGPISVVSKRICKHMK